ncbi:MAG: hypothetical protein ROO70_19035 [Labrenzia sp.]
MRTCIVCGKNAASREHIFPATLGGRRTNKGIYCGDHNNAFSKHANTISDQLRTFNALLAVRPDHSKNATSHEYVDENGDKIAVSRGEVRRVNPPEILEPGMLQGSLHFGGPEALRAIAYIALTFFAHHYPTEARKSDFEDVKTFIEKETPNDYAWWEPHETTNELPENPFLFGHTIVLNLSAETNRITAYVSFFGALTYCVLLGASDISSSQSTVVFIDPLVDHPPNDIQVVHNDFCIAEAVKPEPLQSHLLRMVNDGSVTDGVSDLMDRVNRWKFEAEITPIVNRLNAARKMPESLPQAITSALSDLAGYIFLLLNHLSLKMTDAFEDQPECAPLIPALKQMAIQDRRRPQGISETTEAYIILVTDFLEVEFMKALSKGPIDIDYLWKLFRTSEGLATIGAVVMAPIFDGLRRMARKLD